MLARNNAMTRFVVGMLSGACMAAHATIAHADPNAALSSDAAASTAPARAGQWIHVDPQTGARTAAPADALSATANDPAFSTSHDGLIERPAPGGGVTVDLQGRFRSAVIATVGADGKVAVDCHAPGTAAAGKE